MKKLLSTTILLCIFYNVAHAGYLAPTYDHDNESLLNFVYEQGLHNAKASAGINTSNLSSKTEKPSSQYEVKLNFKFPFIKNNLQYLGIDYTTKKHEDGHIHHIAGYTAYESKFNLIAAFINSDLLKDEDNDILLEHIEAKLAYIHKHILNRKIKISPYIAVKLVGTTFGKEVVPFMYGWEAGYYLKYKISNDSSFIANAKMEKYFMFDKAVKTIEDIYSNIFMADEPITIGHEYYSANLQFNHNINDRINISIGTNTLCRHQSNILISMYNKTNKKTKTKDKILYGLSANIEFNII